MCLRTVVHGPGPDQHPGKRQGPEQVKRKGPADLLTEETSEGEADDAAERTASVDDGGDDASGYNSICLPKFRLLQNLFSQSSYTVSFRIYLVR